MHYTHTCGNYHCLFKIISRFIKLQNTHFLCRKHRNCVFCNKTFIYIKLHGRFKKQEFSKFPFELLLLFTIEVQIEEGIPKFLEFQFYNTVVNHYFVVNCCDSTFSNFN
eukprot:NODE_370_length_9954_cov_0.501776.p7 type:complete len:109 gc:universal NODE_370_length_9954_cov_0.501776:9616-9290(-)